MLTVGFVIAAGGSHLRSPTGGSAKGTPRNWNTLGAEELTKPVSIPLLVLTVGVGVSRRSNGEVKARDVHRTIAVKETTLMSYRWHFQQALRGGES